MPAKKIVSPRAQSPSAAQRALLAEQKRLAKASWKETATATECDRQRHLVLTLLKFSRDDVQAALCVYELTDTDEDADLEQSLKSLVDDAELLYQRQKQYCAAHVKKGKQLLRALTSVSVRESGFPDEDGLPRACL